MNCKVTKDKLKNMVIMYESGKSCREVALYFGLTKSTVEKYINLAGVMRQKEPKKSKKERAKDKAKNLKELPARCSDVGAVCKYRAVSPDYKCDYLSYKGHSRGCDPEECMKFKDENREKIRWNKERKAKKK